MPAAAACSTPQTCSSTGVPQTCSAVPQSCSGVQSCSGSGSRVQAAQAACGMSSPRSSDRVRLAGGDYLAFIPTAPARPNPNPNPNPIPNPNPKAGLQGGEAVAALAQPLTLASKLREHR